MNPDSPTPANSLFDEAALNSNVDAVIDEDETVDESLVDEDNPDGSFDLEAFRASLPRNPAPTAPIEPDSDAKPERVSKLISRAGIASRRAAEEMITEGRVSVNGHFVREPGIKADPTRDRIVVDNRPLAVSEKTTTVVVLHKPKYVMTTRDDPGGRTTVFDLVPRQFAQFYAVGRLDFETTGVLLLTDDGALAHLLTHPSHGVEKTYEARVRGDVSPEAISRLREGLYLEDGKTAPCRARVVAQREKNALVELTLREGRNRQVRRMLEAVGHPVSSLRRVKFAGVELEGMLPGAHRVLLPGELKSLRRNVEGGLKDARRAKRAAFDPSTKPKTKPVRKPLFGPSKTKLAAQAAARENPSNKPVRGGKPVGPYETAKQNARAFADAEQKRLAKPGEAPFRGAARVDESRVPKVRENRPRVDESRVPKVRESRARVEDTSNPLRANDVRPSTNRNDRPRPNASSTRGANPNGFQRDAPRSSAPRDFERTSPRASSTNSSAPFKPSAPRTNPRFDAPSPRANFGREDARESFAPRAGGASSTNRTNANPGAARDDGRTSQPRPTESRPPRPARDNSRDTPSRNAKPRDVKPRDAKPRDERAQPTPTTPLTRRIERKWR